MPSSAATARRRIAAGYASALLVLLAGGAAVHGAERLVQARTEARSANALANAARTVGDAVRDAESGQRGYLLTGRESYLAPYDRAAATTTAAMSRLHALGADRPAMAARIDSLGYFVGLRLAELGETIRLRRDRGPVAAASVVATDRSEEAMAQIRRILAALDRETEIAAARAEGRAAHERDVTSWVVLGLVLAAALIAITLNVTAVRQASEAAQTREELETHAYELQLQTAELAATNSELAAASAALAQRTSEAELQHVRLAGVLASTTDAIVSFDDDCHIVYMNAAAERLLGLDPGSGTRAGTSPGTEPGTGTGISIYDFVPPAYHRGLDDAMHHARRAAARPATETGASAREPGPWDGAIVRDDGSEIPIEVSVAYARTGTISLYTAVLRDVSRQRQLEEQFRQAQKMEAVGRLAGGIAHDFNNLLTVIGASSEFLLHDLGSDAGEVVRDVAEIRRATDRAAALTRQLLAFSRRQIVQPQITDMNAVVSDMEKMLRRLIGEDVTLITEYGIDLDTVQIDRSQLEQIIVNLVVNARDAMPDGGTIVIATENAPLAAAATLAAESVPSGGYVVLCVRDTGVGMDEATRSRIFEPFFTTKEQGKGTGLGLATVYGIVRQYGGDVVVQSEPGAGSEFRLYFPRAEESVAPPAPAIVQVETLRGDETILIVEDEEPLRRLVRRVLESRGYRVLDAADGHEAIRTMARSSAHVDLVLSDVVMPGMSGRELVERLLPVYPWIRVLFMSGYTEDTMLQHRVAELGITVLEKPFTPDALAREVRRTLDRPVETSRTAIVG